MEHDNASKNCILIVDDDFINCELLKNIFSSQYTFEEAASGAEGLSQIERHADELCAIILDVQMPGMSGNLSLTALHAQFTEQVNRLRAGDYAGAEAMMDEITATYNGALSGMKAWLSSNL